MTYDAIGFQEYPADWAARDSVMEQAKQRIPSVMKALQCRDKVSNIPSDRLEVFHGLLEIDRLWKRTIDRLSLENLISPTMAGLMRNCVPGGYLVDLQGRKAQFCAHRFCPWCHYRTYRDTYENLVGYCFDPAGQPKHKHITLVSRSAERADQSAIDTQAESCQTRELIRRIKRTNRFTDGLGIMQLRQDYYSDGTNRYEQVMRFEWNVLGLAPVLSDVEVFDPEHRARLIRKQLPLTRTNLRSILLEAFPYPALVLTMDGDLLSMYSELTVGRKRLRYFGGWNSGGRREKKIPLGPRAAA